VTTLVDSTVLLDIFTEDPRWFDWSSAALGRCADEGALAINPLIYAEVSIRFSRIEDFEAALGRDFERRALPWPAAFLAGKCYLDYRKRGGARSSPLPDFYIGAHAAVEELRLLSRDARRYRTYFPKVRLVAPTS